jgi:hypothetical protein
LGGPEYKGYDLDSDNVETSQKVSNVLVIEEIISRKGLYRESCLIRTSLGPKTNIHCIKFVRQIFIRNDSSEFMDLYIMKSLNKIITNSKN